MKTIIFFTAKRARTPKMQGLATAAGSASVIRELCRLAKAGKAASISWTPRRPSMVDAVLLPSAPATSQTSAPRP